MIKSKTVQSQAHIHIKPYQAVANLKWKKRKAKLYYFSVKLKYIKYFRIINTYVILSFTIHKYVYNTTLYMYIN